MSLGPTPFDLPELARSLTSLPGVGPATAKAFAARGLRTWGDALFFLPLRYEDRRSPTPAALLQEGVVAVVRGRVLSSRAWGQRGKVWRMELEDSSGRLDCLWFRFKKAHLASFEPGREVLVVGKPVRGRSDKAMQMVHPEVYPAAEIGPDHPSVGRIIPVYPALEGVRPGSLRKVMSEVLKRTVEQIPDPLAGLLPKDIYPMPAGRAMLWAHNPPSDADQSGLDPKAAPSRRALAVNELAYFELALALQRKQRAAAKTLPLGRGGSLMDKFIKSLPFELTPGQRQAVGSIREDMTRKRPMARLLAGDVGAGKTVVAAAAACLAAGSGVQAAFMAPTEVLARQHYENLSKYLKPLGVEAALAIGAMNGADKKEAAEAAANGAGLVIGTHALISAGMGFKKLGLVIIDEQHRFGVGQRLGLAAKGEEPHLLVLSATPIPRTLALALAGHLDISDLPERPGKRPHVNTRMLAHDRRGQAVEAIGRALGRGERVFVICPLVAASDKVEAWDAEQTHRRLADYYPDAGVGLLHGRMGSEGQRAAMEDFRAGRTQILVATTVVEVGVDVPEATVMVVLGAERFGLSQLHQLRGRVGRGERPGTCLLVAGPQPGELGMQRLETLCKTMDGRQVAEADLFLRGPGEVLGFKQSGLPPFRVASWERDAGAIPILRESISSWLKNDADMRSPELAPVKREALRRWGGMLGLREAG